MQNSTRPRPKPRRPNDRPTMCYTLGGMARLSLPRMTPCAAVQTVLAWPARRLVVAVLAAAATVLIVAVPTALIPNPVFGREIAPEPWSWPTLWVTAVLAGALVATYVRSDDGARAPHPATATGSATAHADSADRLDTPSRAGMVGGFLGYLAVGCPVCNKLALLALGYTGALTWFAPLQPILAVAGIALLAYALLQRLAAESSGACATPVRRRVQDSAGSPAEVFAPPGGPVLSRSRTTSDSTEAQPPSQ